MVLIAPFFIEALRFLSLCTKTEGTIPLRKAEIYEATFKSGMF